MTLHHGAWAAIAVLVLTLTGCAGAGAGGEPPAQTDAAPDSPASPSETAADAEPENSDCENRALTVLASNGPRVASADDIARAEAGMGIDVPESVSCVIAYDDGTGIYVLAVWLDDPSIVDALLSALEGTGLPLSEEQASGYALTYVEDGATSATVAPIGVGNATSVWSQAFPDVDVTLFGVAAP